MAATNSKVLGTVTSVVGEVKATASDGTTRILQVGDKVFSDEVISTSPTGDVKIALEGSGRTLECGNDSNIALSPALLGIGTAIAGQDASPVIPPSVAATQEVAAPAGKPPAGPTDVSALQAAIAAGADPSQVAEATAAGGAPGAGGPDGGGGHQPVVIEQGNTTTPVTSGFNTRGGSIDFPNPQINELPPEEGAPVVSVSVQVEVEVEDPENPGSPGDGVVVSGNAASLIEGTNGEGGGKLVNFIITLDKPFDTEVLVTYTIVPGTAETPSDFFDGPLTQTITIPAGETEIIIPVIIVEDHFVENNETFSIVLVDAVNATINPTANTAVVTIVDDDALPVANADTNWVREDAFVGEGDAPMASGNVLLTQSHPGDPSDALSFTDAADTDLEPLTVTTTGTFNGTYGTLALNSDGSYTYTLNNSHPDVQALDDGETLADAFQYSVTDGYNAPSSSTLTITIFSSDDGVIITDLTPAIEGGEATVSDANLPDGSSPNASALTKSGDFTISAPDGVASLTVAGTAVITNGVFSAATVTTALGNSLSITGYDATTGKVNYSYTLLDNEAHSQPANDTSVFDSVAVVLTDDDGDTDSDTLSITVLDDVPSIDITGGSASVVEGQNITNGTWTSESGADAPASIKVVVGESEFDLGTPINTGKGTLTVNANGTWSFAAANGLDQDVAQSVGFTVKITDTDGDVDTDSHTVNITDGAGPGDAQGVSLTVQEAEITDSANAAMSFTLGSDALASIGFSGAVGSITGDYADLTINWVLSGDKQTLSGTVQGEPGATVVLTLTGVNLATGAATVNVQISDEFKHVAPASGADNNDFTITGIEVVATDIDGDVAEGLASVTVVDDVPTIEVTAGATTVVEGQSINNGAWTSDPGADGGVVKVRFNGADYDLDQAIDTGKGTLTVNANGTWTFAAANNLDQDVAQNVSFDLRMTDADGDFASDSHTISITDGAGPAASAPQSMVVEEAALSDGTNPSSPDEVDTALLTFTSGSDAITSITFGSTAGINVAGLDESQTITWAVSNGGRTLTGSINGDAVIRVELSGASTVAAGGAAGNVTATATLLNNMLHQNSPDADSLTITGVQVVAADPDGSTATFTFTGITVNDDAPTVAAPSGTIENDVGESLAGLVDYDMNADGLGAVTLNAPTVTSGGQAHTLKSNGHTIVYQITDDGDDGLQELKAYADNDNNGFDAGDTLVFTLAPAAPDAVDGSYTLTMNDVVDLPVPIISLAFTNIFSPNQIDDRVAIQDSADGPSSLLISAVNSGDKVTDSASFVGIHNNVMNAGETIRYEFGTVDLTSGDATFMTVTEKKLVNDVQLFSFDTGGSPDSFSWVAYRDGGEVGSGSVSPTTLPQGNSGALFPAIHVDGGYDTVVFTVSQGSEFKVGGVTYTELGAPQDVNLNVAFGGADADGDTIGGSFNVTITGGDGTAESNIIQTLLNNNQPV